MLEPPPKRLSPVKWVLGILGFLAVIVFCSGLPMFFSGLPAAPPAPTPLGTIISGVLGLVLIFMAGCLYGLILATACFTFNFNKPIYGGFKYRAWAANLVVSLLFLMGLAFITMPALLPLAQRVLPAQVATLAAFFGPFVVMQIVLIWLTPWAPLDAIAITRRLRAIGITDEQFKSGWLMGISDPTQSSMKKFPTVEQDIGMMWLNNDCALYIGDTQSFSVPHAQLLAIERKADAGATSSYFGAVHVIIRFTDSAGAERVVRLHPEATWTMTANARALNAIAQTLVAWKANPIAGWKRSPAGFAVVAGGSA